MMMKMFSFKIESLPKIEIQSFTLFLAHYEIESNYSGKIICRESNGDFLFLTPNRFFCWNSMLDTISERGSKLGFSSLLHKMVRKFIWQFYYRVNCQLEPSLEMIVKRSSEL